MTYVPGEIYVTVPGETVWIIEQHPVRVGEFWTPDWLGIGELFTVVSSSKLLLIGRGTFERYELLSFLALINGTFRLLGIPLRAKEPPRRIA